MSEQVVIEGKEYISSKRAAELSGYAQDYIGQLARGGLVDAQRIGGLWFVLMASLETYKAKAEMYKPQPPVHTSTQDPDSLLTFDGKDYVSAARAAKLTGYHQDYVGQLARAGTVLSRQVGNRWYVEREGVLAHKKEKDALLAAVQAESVGLTRPPESFTEARNASQAASQEEEPLFTYTSDESDLVPLSGIVEVPEEAPMVQRIPIQKSGIQVGSISRNQRGEQLQTTSDIKRVTHRFASSGSSIRASEKTISYGIFLTVAAVLVLIVGAGLVRVKHPAMFATVFEAVAASPVHFAADKGQVFEPAIARVGDILENIVVRDLVYHRSD